MRRIIHTVIKARNDDDLDQDSGSLCGDQWSNSDFEDRTVKDLLMQWIEYIMMNRIWGVEEGGIKNDA